ncbi:MAG: PA14 domain-containing protein [Sulfolobales archaeon]
MKYILVRIRRGLTQGLKGYYGNISDLSNIRRVFEDLEMRYKFDRIDPVINFVFYEDYPVPNVHIDGMVVKWRGLVEIPRSGVYRFFVEADDGAQVVLNKKIVIDALENSSAKRVYSEELFLHEGFLEIEINYFNTGVFGYLSLGWNRNYGIEEIVPSKYLYTLEGNSVIISNVPRDYKVKLIFNGIVYEGYTRGGLILFPLNYEKTLQYVGEGKIFIYNVRGDIIYESPLIQDMSPGDIYSLRSLEDT